MARREKTQEAEEKETLPKAEDGASLVPLDAVLYTMGHMLSWNKSDALLLSQEHCKFTSWEVSRFLSQGRAIVEKGIKPFGFYFRKMKQFIKIYFFLFCLSYFCEESYQVNSILEEDIGLISTSFVKKEQKRESFFKSLFKGSNSEK